MTNFNRTALVALCTENFAAQEKVARNAQKLAWIDATRRDGADAIYFGEQLAKYQTDARSIAQRFADACSGLSTEEIVSIISESQGWAA